MMINIFNFKSFIKFLNKNRLYTFIEIFGLSLSLTFVILIGIYTMQELSTDHFQDNRDRLYFLANQDDFGFAYRLGNRIKDRYPEIEDVCTIMSQYKKQTAIIAENKMNADLLFTEPSFFDLLSFGIKEGDKQTPLPTRNYAVISESFAKKAFPNKDPLGQLIQLSNGVVLTVNAVMKDINNSVIPYGDILLKMENLEYWNKDLVSEQLHNYGTVSILIQAREGTDLKAKESDLLGYLKQTVWTYEKEMDTDVAFVPFKDVYFSPLKGENGNLVNQGDRTFVLILLSVGILILLFAIINYVNLTVAQTGFRAKEMATRRLLGSSRKELFLRLMIESIAMVFLSFLFSMLFAYWAASYAGNLLESQINLAAILSLKVIFIVIMSIILIGSISGFLPAIIISNAKPIEVVKGAFRQQTKMVFSKFFITFQNMITIALVAASLVMVIQTHHLIKAPLGYNTTNIIDIDVQTLDNKQTMLTLGNEIQQLASVKRVAYSQGMPFSTGNNYSYHKDNKIVSLQSIIGDNTYFDMLGFQILQENNVASGNAFYLSSLAFKELNLPENTMSFTLEPFFSGSLPIAGIVKDFQLSNIAYESRPILLRRQKVEDFTPWNIAVEVEGDPFKAFDEIQSIYERITNLDFPGKFIDHQIAESFVQYRRTAKIVMLFAGIAILLSLLGLIAMSTYFIQQRSREISVRKVFGSSNPEILKRLVFTFLNYVLIAFLIVTPLIWYIMREWLNGFSYRIPLSLWIFISSGLFYLLLSFITVFWQSYTAANENPVNNLKVE